MIKLIKIISEDIVETITPELISRLISFTKTFTSFMQFIETDDSYLFYFRLLDDAKRFQEYLIVHEHFYLSEIKSDEEPFIVEIEKVSDRINNINDAIAFIKKAHEGQVDKNGKPYWEHPYRVMNRLPKNAPYDAKIAALFHDILEDTNYTEEDLRELGVSQNAINIIKIVTRHKNKKYEDFIKDILSSGNEDAKLVKIADLEDNSDPSRKLPQEFAGLMKRYEKSLKILKND